MQTNRGIGGTHRTLKSASSKIIVRLLETMKLTKYNCANARTASPFCSPWRLFARALYGINLWQQ